VNSRPQALDRAPPRAAAPPRSAILWPRIRRGVAAVVIYLALFALAALFLLPLYWMIATAVKPQQLVYRFPPDWFAGDLTLANFRTAWGALPFGRFFLNSAFVTVLTAFGTVLSSSLAGFGFARYRARGAGVLFLVLLATMMVPPSTTLVPRFVMFSKIGWTDSYLPLVVPPFFAGAFHVFLFRQFFRAVPREYFDAAEIDGCSPLGLWWRVALPMARPAIAASAMFSALTAWNDFIDPLVFLSSMDKLTLQIGLSTFQGQYFQQLHLMMPMALLGVLPVLVLVVVGQRWIAHGLAPDVEK
jgi:ABC-type glycerol-3-phosphate transport system permease component